MKNIQVIDGADNATYSIFQATDSEFRSIFSGPEQDLEIVEDYISRVGESEASITLSNLWERPIQKRDALGIHGTLFYDYDKKRRFLPESRREIDRAAGQINDAQRALYSQSHSAV